MIANHNYAGPARLLAGLIVLIAVGSVLLQLALNLRSGGSVIEGIWILARYFTILTNLLVAVVFATIAIGRAVSPRMLLASVAAIAGVGLVYHALLAHLYVQVGLEIVADQGVHTAVPALSVAWFIAFAPTQALRWRDTLFVMIWPTLYCVYALVRGAASGIYPYPFVDATVLEPGQMAINIAGLTLFFLLLGLALFAAVRLRFRAARS
ncbi:Pr6Pr family membrane protein [Erythrobacter alti]|uniref:Pr6Pr family membrane protein n=1 Tax=Erythrobacter alti TaxID=1896145 RepID=UPI0030F46763